MQNKEYTHYRIINITQIVVSLLVEIIILWLLSISNTWKIWLSLVALFSNAMFLFLFYKSTIMITDESLLFKFGVGLISIPFEYDEIECCVPLEMPRVSSNGVFSKIPKFANRITNTKAVELQFFGKDTVTQLETGSPFEVASDINKVLEARKRLTKIERNG